MNQNITFRKALDYKKSIAANIIGFFTKNSSADMRVYKCDKIYRYKF